jgi:hypothetical protein
VGLLERDRGNPDPVEVTLSVGPGQSARFVDVLDGLFGFDGAAALRVERGAGELVVASRTYNQGAAGTYGQSVPFESRGRLFGPDRPARLIQLERSDDPGTGFRTNIGVVSLAEVRTDVALDLFTAAGAALGSMLLRLEPYEYRQITDVFAWVGASTVEDGFAVLRGTSNNALFACYASVVDNVTGDPVYIPGM